MTLPSGNLFKNKRSIYLTIGFIFIVKLLTVLYLIHLSRCLEPSFFSGLASMTGDAPSYITPIDNYIDEGSYYYQSAKAGRMPYVGLVYYPFRLLFEKEIAVSILVILQVLAESIAIYYMALLCVRLFKSQVAFWIFIFLSLISLHITFFDYYILSESFGISFLCLFAYQYYSYLTGERSNKQLAFTGLLLALTILFKPYFSLLFILIGVELLWHHRKLKFSAFVKKIIASVIITSVPLIVLDAPWTIRNYKLLNKFIPFQQDIYAGYSFPPAVRAYVNFLKTIGESFVFFDKRSAGCYFDPVEGLPCEYKFPERIFSASLTMNKIEEARNALWEYKRNLSDSTERVAIQKFDSLTETYKHDHTFAYYFLTPVILSKNFIIHSGSYFLPVKKGSDCYRFYQWGIKILQTLMYYLALIVGFTGTFLMLRKYRASFIIFSIPVYLIIFFPVILQATEFRYFHPAYPFLLIGLTYILFLILNYYSRRLLRNKSTINAL